MQHGNEMVEKVLYAQAKVVKISLRSLRQILTSLLSDNASFPAFIDEPCRGAIDPAVHLIKVAYV